MNDRRQPRKQRRQRKPRKATATSLDRAALHYLGRYASSAANLRRVLMRRVERSAWAHGTDAEEGAKLVEDIVERFQRARLLDDLAYAEGRAQSLHRRGASLRAIRTRLVAKGVAVDDIEAALAALGEDTADPDRTAALAYARRRRIGPWRKGERDAFRERDLAALSRQGFSYDIARWVVGAESVEELEAELVEEAGLSPDLP